MTRLKHAVIRALAIVTVAALSCTAPRTIMAAPPGHPLRIAIIGLTAPSFDPAVNPAARELTEGLREAGYTLGRDFVFDYRSTAGTVGIEDIAQTASELLKAKPDLLVTQGTRPTLAAAKATTSVPIIMVGANDVVETGLVASLAKPGGNITGLAINGSEISAKRVQLLQEAVPGLSRVAVLWNGSLKSMTLQFQNIEQVAPQLGVVLQSIRVGGSDDFDRAFAAITASGADGMIVLFGPLRGDDLPRIVDFVSRHKLPTIFEIGRGVSGGGLMEFGPNRDRMFRRAAAYVDKVANGAPPATLPVEEPTQFELVINMKAAKSMSFAVPHSLLLRADEIIE